MDDVYRQTMMDLRLLLIKRGHEGDSAELSGQIRRKRAEILTLSAPPLTRLDAVSKCHRLEELGPLSVATLERAFPLFNSDTFEERTKLFRKHALPFEDFGVLEAEQACKEAGVRYQRVGPNRRYSGERNLPRACYYSVCQHVDADDFGDDRQTLCRELFEYADPRLPGYVFVTDSYSRHPLGTPGSRGPNFRHGILVYMLAPPASDAAKLALWREWFQPVLARMPDPDAQLAVTHIPTNFARVSIDNVLDLRREAARKWLWVTFGLGADNAIYLHAKPFSRFETMLPHLIYPEFGGSGLTLAIGSWMRSVGVSGLVFPSARSNASVKNHSADQIEYFHGWNFVDYRGAELVPDSEIHVDLNDPYGFVACRGNRPRLEIFADGWRIHDNEIRWRELEKAFGQICAGRF
jgi:hypothetical protein